MEGKKRDATRTRNYRHIIRTFQSIEDDLRKYSHQHRIATKASPPEP